MPSSTGGHPAPAAAAAAAAGDAAGDGRPPAGGSLRAQFAGSAPEAAAAQQHQQQQQEQLAAHALPAHVQWGAADSSEDASWSVDAASTHFTASSIGDDAAGASSSAQHGVTDLHQQQQPQQPLRLRLQHQHQHQHHGRHAGGEPSPASPHQHQQQQHHHHHHGHRQHQQQELVATASPRHQQPLPVPPPAATGAGDEAPPARFLRAHTSRPPVARGLLHHAAKAFGVTLRGDVATNEISTAKYTLLTFLPVNLFEQFLRVANLYFLLMAILQFVPGLSPTSFYTTVAPLVFVLGVNAIKEGYDDVHRHRNDNQVNNRLVLRLCSEAGEEEEFWKDVVAGDLIKVREGEEVPADLLLLSTPDPENLCYVETANLDGETNLKIKYCWPGCVRRTGVKQFEGFAQCCRVGCEAPNPKLYVFDGFVETTPPGGGPPTKSPVDINNLLLRGSVLRTTPWAIGMAINVGRDSKIVQNMTKAPRKVTRLEQAMNVLVLVQFGILLVFCAVLAGLDQWWATGHSAPRVWYLESLNQYPDLPPGGLGWFISFLRFIILLSNLIPISLYVTLEVVKVFQCALLLNQDRRMYHAASDTPFVCRTTALNEELGQVQYVLSDKTGTLTQNVMGFVWASVGGRLYGCAADDAPEEPAPLVVEGVPGDTPHSIVLDRAMRQAAGLLPPASQHGSSSNHNNGAPADGAAAAPVSPAVHDFLLALALCNTVVPARDDDGKITYQASSPDEEALVAGAAGLGYRLTSRTTEAATVDVRGRLLAFDIMATLEFNSDRKRMSTIIRPRDGGPLSLICKGADSIVLARLQAAAGGKEEAPALTAAKQHLDDMAQGGLRTLLIAQRDISAEEYTAWQEAYSAAQVAMVDREARMAAEQERIEVALRLLGATGVEDKLQDGVPQCLVKLAQAGIKVWVLTGDKVETAISIAHSCCLFEKGMGEVQVREADFGGIDHSDVEAARSVLAAKRAEVAAQDARVGAAPGHTNTGIVIEGGALALALHPDLQDDLLSLCTACRAVVCCRVSPMQKAQITTMVKNKAGAVTLGIGDGANDVGMIRAAHIGVGISGREGRAAVLASDFSFAQFEYLARLLLVHGRWSYMRNQEVVLYSFYKNWAYVLVYVYLQFLAGFSAVPIFTTWLISTFNMIFTACPIVAYAVLEQDLAIHTIMAHPQTYAATRTATRASVFTKFIVYVFVVGTWHSLPAFFVPWYTLGAPDFRGTGSDLAGAGTAVFIALVCVVTIKLFLRTRCWSWITHLVYWLSLALLFPFVAFLSAMWGAKGWSELADMSGVAGWLFTGAVFWLGALLLTPAIALLPDIAVLLFRRCLRPDIATLLQEREVLAALDAEVERRRTVKQQQTLVVAAPLVATAAGNGQQQQAGSPKKGGGISMGRLSRGSKAAAAKRGSSHSSPTAPGGSSQQQRAQARGVAEGRQQQQPLPMVV